MKKRAKQEDVQAQEVQEVEVDITGILGRMQQQIVFLEKKIDILINQSQQRPAERRPESNYRDNSYRERTLHKAVCADCAKECEVPFKPTGERPVYCKDCFAKRKGGSSFKDREHSAPREEKAEKGHFYDKPLRWRKKSHGGKKPGFQKRRKRK